MLIPPFDHQSAQQKTRQAEDAWNSCDPHRVSQVYSEDTRWRNRSEFIQGREAVVAFLQRKGAREHEYRLIRELWAWHHDKLAVRFACEWHDDSGNGFRSYGNENWQSGADGLMVQRFACINDLPIAAADRLFHWPAGRRPDDHPGLSASGF